MKSAENKSETKILNSGVEFFRDLESSIDGAKNFILIKQFLWRNDKTGRMIAKALLKAMNRGVKVYIHKDRIGAFHEYAERTGQSFFHDEPQSDEIFGIHSLKTVYYQASLMISKFYGNGVSPQIINPLKNELVGHVNSEIFDKFKLYDHSKVVVVDGKIAYVGGIGFGDEFMGNDKEKPWRDYMLKIVDENECSKLLCLLSGDVAGESSSLFQFLNDSSLQKSGSSLHDYVLKFIAGAKKNLFIEVPFLGHPDYINQITKIIKSGVKTVIVLPAKANTHHYRNMHFLKRLIRQVNHSDCLSVYLTPDMAHGKVIISDDAMLFGSHNLHMDRAVLEETAVKITDKILVEDMKKKIIKNASMGENFDGSIGWIKIIIPSRAEYVSIKLQTFMKMVRVGDVKRCREKCNQSIKICI